MLRKRGAHAERGRRPLRTVALRCLSKCHKYASGASEVACQIVTRCIHYLFVCVIKYHDQKQLVDKKCLFGAYGSWGSIHNGGKTCRRVAKTGSYESTDVNGRMKKKVQWKRSKAVNSQRPSLAVDFLQQGSTPCRVRDILTQGYQPGTTCLNM